MDAAAKPSNARSVIAECPEPGESTARGRGQWVGLPPEPDVRKREQNHPTTYE
ncbi:hypothetical protein DPMN_127248 [Dreissena polymorpha]|uniref:Uncharacterized protein n=1 Tax=Dreissena polymorpha TaxID=45954 RepID=A0A9D4H0X0_DREPO|nr:hypothetical protein DPMN_127248 [Dreissena polymorpha]